MQFTIAPGKRKCMQKYTTSIVVRIIALTRGRKRKNKIISTIATITIYIAHLSIFKLEFLLFCRTVKIPYRNFLICCLVKI